MGALRDEATGGGEGGGGEPAPAPATLGGGGDVSPAGGEQTTETETTQTTPAEVNFANYLDEGADVASYRKAMGIPETVADYKLSFSEGFEVDAGTAQYLQETGHKLGISPKALEQLAEGYTKRQADMAQTEAVKRSQEHATVLKSEWGGDYDSRFEGAARAAKALCSMGGIDSSFLSDPAIGGHPSVIKLMDQVNGMMREAKAAGIATAADVSGGLAECRRIETDSNHPLHKAYMDPNHPDHKHADSVYNKHMLNP